MQVSQKLARIRFKGHGGVAVLGRRVAPEQQPAALRDALAVLESLGSHGVALELNCFTISDALVTELHSIAIRGAASAAVQDALSIAAQRSAEGTAQGQASIAAHGQTGTAAQASASPAAQQQTSTAAGSGLSMLAC